MINYLNLHKSIEFYEKYNFSRIEAPWTVSEYVDNLTKPIDKIPFILKHNNKHLVASGEQSFLYLYLKNFLPKGTFQCITPCFRMDSFSYTHTKYFIKNELIKTDFTTNNDLTEIIDMAYNFHNIYFENKNDLKIIKTNDGYDINYLNHELGSYGIRENDFLKWIYATGCAEPRLSTIHQLYLNGLSHN